MKYYDKGEAKNLLEQLAAIMAGGQSSFPLFGPAEYAFVNFKPIGYIFPRYVYQKKMEHRVVEFDEYITDQVYVQPKSEVDDMFEITEPLEVPYGLPEEFFEEWELLVEDWGIDHVDFVKLDNGNVIFFKNPSTPPFMAKKNPFHWEEGEEYRLRKCWICDEEHKSLYNFNNRLNHVHGGDFFCTPCWDWYREQVMSRREKKSITNKDLTLF